MRCCVGSDRTESRSVDSDNDDKCELHYHFELTKLPAVTPAADLSARPPAVPLVVAGGGQRPRLILAEARTTTTAI